AGAGDTEVGSKSIRVGLYCLARSQFLNTYEHGVGIWGDMSRGSVGFNNTAGMAKLVQREGGLQLPVWRRHSAVCSARGLSQGQSSLAPPVAVLCVLRGNLERSGHFCSVFVTECFFFFFFTTSCASLRCSTS
ncbi:MAG: hypothetical protein DMG32_02890, partial [Acidobacteria bacterium]